MIAAGETGLDFTRRLVESADELEAVLHNDVEVERLFERLKWPDGITCHKCGADRLSKIAAESGAWRCLACQTKVTIKVGTFMQGTPTPLRNWAQVFHFALTEPDATIDRLLLRVGIGKKSAEGLLAKCLDAIREPYSPNDIPASQVSVSAQNDEAEPAPESGRAESAHLRPRGRLVRLAAVSVVLLTVAIVWQSVNRPPVIAGDSGPLVETWMNEDAPVMATTDRLPGEAVDDWQRRHLERVEAIRKVLEKN